MECSSEKMTIYLDCPQLFISKLKTATSLEVVEHLATSVARMVSSISQDWSMNQIASLVLCIDTFKSIIESISRESFENVLGLLILLQLELLAGMYHI